MPLFGRRKTREAAPKVSDRRLDYLWSLEPTISYDGKTRELLTQLIRELKQGQMAVNDERLRFLWWQFFKDLRLKSTQRLEALGGEAQAAYVQLCERDEAPSDAELVAYWRAHIPNYPQFYWDVFEDFRSKTVAVNS